MCILFSVMYPFTFTHLQFLTCRLTFDIELYGAHKVFKNYFINNLLYY